jgi:hypothetical protein
MRLITPRIGARTCARSARAMSAGSKGCKAANSAVATERSVSAARVKTMIN